MDEPVGLQSLEYSPGLTSAGTAKNFDGGMDVFTYALSASDQSKTLESILFGGGGGKTIFALNGGPDLNPPTLVGSDIVDERGGASIAQDHQVLYTVTFSEGIDPVIKAALAHLRFVTIHPFADGNGRIARAIADMALARSDGMPERFYSMSYQIELERKDYYTQLERQQKGDIDVTEWLGWFLGCLGRAIESAETHLESVLYKSRLWERANMHSVNERQRKVLNRMLDDFKGHMNTSKYAKLAKTSPDSALRDIKDLVTWGILVQNPGGGRSTSYRLAAQTRDGITGVLCDGEGGG
jgi:hypothetical protein